MYGIRSHLLKYFFVVPPAGGTSKTDQAIIQGEYRRVRQPRSNGYAYNMATGPTSNTLEYVK